MAANEAEKAANINILEVRAFGSFGRVYIGGLEKDIEVARPAAVAESAYPTRERPALVQGQSPGSAPPSRPTASMAAGVCPLAAHWPVASRS